jgi:hypothetical protein
MPQRLHTEKKIFVLASIFSLGCSIPPTAKIVIKISHDFMIAVRAAVVNLSGNKLIRFLYLQQRKALSKFYGQGVIFLVEWEVTTYHFVDSRLTL